MRPRVVFRSVPSKYRDLYDKIRENRLTIDHYCYIYRGIWTGVLRVFVVDEEIIEKYGIEDGALKPILRGKDIYPFYYKFNNRWVIYTNQENFYEKYPNTIKYLSERKVILERRGAVWIHGRNWWELEDPLKPEMFEVEKLVAPYVSNRNSFALDTENYYVMDSTIVVRFWRDDGERKEYYSIYGEEIHKKDFQTFAEASKQALEELEPNLENLKYILGILNSDLAEFYIKLYAPRMSKRSKRPPKGRYFLYIPPYPNIIPIEVAEKETRRKIAELTDKISKISLEIDELKSEQKEEEKEKLEEKEKEKNKYLIQLNEIVFEIYQMSEKEKTKIQTYVLKKR